jgi:hypothetical protein
MPPSRQLHISAIFAPFSNFNNSMMLTNSTRLSTYWNYEIGSQSVGDICQVCNTHLQPISRFHQAKIENLNSLVTDPDLFVFMI